MRYERLLAELVAGLLLGSPMYKCSHEPLFVCVLVGRKEEPPSGSPVWLLVSSLSLGWHRWLI